MSAICLTFGEQSENHFGMEKNGQGLAQQGYTLEELKTIGSKYPEHEIINLSDFTTQKTPSAYVLIIRNAIDEKDQLFKEMKELDWDKKYWDTRRQKVLNKHARYNLCFSNNDQAPDYENKKGRIVSYAKLPFLNKLRNKLLDIVKEDTLEVEGNYYYDLKKSGIGFHGDAERKKVIGVNLSDSEETTREIHWRWYQNNKPFGEPCIIELRHGDMYVMSDYATGNNWKRSSLKTLRHAAGIKGSKFLKTK